jgi:DNA-binding NarL/FixJ family response regulator
MIQPMKLKGFLLLDGRDDHHWLRALQEAASALDRALEVVSEAEREHIRWRDYDLIILDAGVVSDLVSTIHWIHLQDSGARVVVLSSAPTWKQAREVMLAGAMDYARKSLNREHILSTLKRNLTGRAPSWQRQGLPPNGGR